MPKSAWAIAADLIDPQDGWQPQPKQRLATRLASEVDDLLYGGATGGGKTEWMLEYMIEQMEAHPNNRGVIFRRVAPSLHRTVIPRAKAKLSGGRAAWNGNEATFTFPNGSVLEMASLPYADDVYKHQGAEYGVVAFEEITEFLQSQVEYMIGRLRAPADGIRPHLIATTNPGGRGHKWVKRWWVKPLPDDLLPEQERPKPCERWRPAPSEDQPRPRVRAFVPATIEDNQVLLERDPGYVDRVTANSNRALRKAYRHGDWDAIDAVEGALWTPEDLDGGRIRPEKLPRSQRRVVAVDPSDGEEQGDEYGIAVASLGVDGVGYQEQSEAWRGSPRKLAEGTVRLAEEVGADAIVIEKNHGGKWLLEVFRQIDPYANIHVVWASKAKRTRAEPVAALFEKDERPDRMPYRARLVGFQDELEDELTQTVFSTSESSPNRLDAMVWAFHDLIIGSRLATATEDVDDLRLAGRR